MNPTATGWYWVWTATVADPSPWHWTKTDGGGFWTRFDPNGTDEPVVWGGPIPEPQRPVVTIGA